MRSIIGMFLAMLLIGGCGTVGDGQILGGDAKTDLGKRLVTRTAAVKQYMDEHPQARSALRLARAAACIARPGVPVICSSAEVLRKIVEVRALVEEARVAGDAIDESDRQIADGLKGLGYGWLAEANEQAEQAVSQ